MTTTTAEPSTAQAAAAILEEPQPATDAALALASQPPPAPVLPPGTPTTGTPALAFTRAQIELIKRTVCKGASDDQLQLFLYQARRTGLDPLAKQIHAVIRWDSQQEEYVMAIQTAIDGLRLIAERTGHYRGQLGPFWCGDDGKWADVWLHKEPPFAAKVGVLRDDFKEPLWAVARFTSYCARRRDGGLNHFWNTLPDLMIAKCAEALALRRAYPQELSGILADEEMMQADTARPPTNKPADDGNGKGNGNGNGKRRAESIDQRIADACKMLGTTEAERTALFKDHQGDKAKVLEALVSQYRMQQQDNAAEQGDPPAETAETAETADAGNGNGNGNGNGKATAAGADDAPPPDDADMPTAGELFDGK